MEFVQKQLDNGLVLIGEVNKSAESAAVGFFVKTGSRDETAEISGVSHFLEHMLFKGTDKLSALEVNEAFDRTGAQFNAFTSEENTVYYASVLPEYLEEVTKLWINLMRPALRDEDFDMEKNVIKEEIAMYQDLPGFDVMDTCRTLHFGDHACGNSVLGSEQSIDDMSADQMREYFTRRYSPNNIVFACSGNFDCERLFSVVAQGCGGWEPKSIGRELTHHNGTSKKERTAKASLAREHICLMSEGVSAQDPRRYAAHLLAYVVGDHTGSRFYWDLVDNAIAEDASMQFGAMDGTGAFCSYIQCSGDKLGQVLETVETILGGLSTNAVTEDELTKAKNKVLSALVIKNELPMGRLVDLGFNWQYLGRYQAIDVDVKAIKAVSVDDVMALVRDLKPERFTQLTLGPASNNA